MGLKPVVWGPPVVLERVSGGPQLNDQIEPLERSLTPFGFILTLSRDKLSLRHPALYLQEV